METQKIVIAKFGGTSLASAEQFRKVRLIVQSNQERKIVVVSAPGKRYDKDDKITDLLIRAFKSLSCQEQCVNFDDVYSRFSSIIETLFDDQAKREEIKQELVKLEENVLPLIMLGGINQDFWASRGEYLSARIMAIFLDYTFIDAKGLFFFNGDGKLDREKTYKAICDNRSTFERGAVVPGFYGSNPDGSIRVFSRGGSDVTGAIIAAALKIDYENWSDQTGMRMIDPHIAESLVIREMGYRELAELSVYGATIIHPDVASFLEGAGVALNIRNTNNPNDPGTWVKPENEKQTESHIIITGVAGRKNFVALNVNQDGSNEKAGFLSDILDVFRELNISVDHLVTSNNGVSLFIQKNRIEAGVNSRIFLEISKKLGKSATIIWDYDIAVVAVVGKAMSHTPGVLGRIGTALGKVDINIEFVSQTYAEITIVFGVKECHMDNAILTIYKEFCAIK